MLHSTYPQAGRNLRELLLRLIAEDTAIQHRLRGARMRGKVLGCPLTTYNPRLPLVGDRVMLLGDAAGLINPLNGEGIQYALHSARWAADIAYGCLSSDRLDAVSLESYQRWVHRSMRKDMAFSRLIVQLIRNRHLNPLWLQAVRIIAARASTDPDYAYRIGCVLTGLTPATNRLGLSVAVKTAEQAIVSARPGTAWRRHGRRGRSMDPSLGISWRRIGTATSAPAANELVDWTAGAGRALAELITQVIHAKVTETPQVAVEGP